MQPNPNATAMAAKAEAAAAHGCTQRKMIGENQRQSNECCGEPDIAKKMPKIFFCVQCRGWLPPPPTNLNDMVTKHLAGRLATMDPKV